MLPFDINESAVKIFCRTFNTSIIKLEYARCFVFRKLRRSSEHDHVYETIAELRYIVKTAFKVLMMNLGKRCMEF